MNHREVISLWLKVLEVRINYKNTHLTHRRDILNIIVNKS